MWCSHPGCGGLEVLRASGGRVHRNATLNPTTHAACPPPAGRDACTTIDHAPECPACFCRAALICCRMPQTLPPPGASSVFTLSLLDRGSIFRKCRLGLALFEILMVALAGSSLAADEDWSVATRSSGIIVYERARKGFSFREFKAVGVMEAPPEVVKRVIDDVSEYPHFMPYVTEARVISTDGANRVSYQRIAPPLVSDLDYTVRVTCETHATPAGKCFCNRWQAANELGPAEKHGVKRVKITEGSWLLEPEDEGRKTRATYCIFSDSGGSMPTFITNTATKTAIPKLFKSIEKQALLPKYLHPSQDVK